MPNALAVPAQASQPARQPQGVLLPFTRGATDHAEPFFDQTFTLTASQQILGPIDVAAYGYARAIVIQVDVATTANAAAVTLLEDAPWSLFAELVFQDVNGAPIFQHSGYETYLHHKCGGFRAQRDPKLLPPGVFAALTTGAVGTAPTGKFLERVNLERSARDGLGSLGNMNASQAYKIRGTINNLASVFGVVPAGGSTTMRVRMTLEAYSQPNATDEDGRPQMTVPPANQTTGYGSRFQPTVNAGQNTVRHTRVGNLLRNLIYIQRRAGTSRANGELDLVGLQLQWFLDSRLWTNYSIESLRAVMAEGFGLTAAAADAAGGIDNGVFVLPVCMIDFDGFAGFEMRDMWMPTTQATRLELQYTLANAGVLTVMTDDVAPRGDVYIT